MDLAKDIIFCFGDQLTCSRFRTNQVCRLQSELQDRWRYICPQISGFHAHMTFLQGIWNVAMNEKFLRDPTSLPALRLHLNRKVPKKVANNYYRCDQFFDAVTDGHLVSAFLAFAGMENKESESQRSKKNQHH